MTTETLDELVARHKKETKELLAKTTALKKTATKGEKKKKKDIMKQVEDLEKQLKSRHQEELTELENTGSQSKENGDKNIGIDSNNVNVDDHVIAEEDDLASQLLAEMDLNEETNEMKPNKIDNEIRSGPKKNRRKEKLAKRKEEELKIYQQAQDEAADQPDLRKIELENIALLCKKQNLVQKEIAADGHCLFASISDELQHRHEISKSVQELRNDAAKHIRSDPDTFSPFLFDEDTLSIKDLESYCIELVETPVWGGDMEILALAKAYDCPISILFSGRPTMIMNEQGRKPMLKLVYYKHSFGLGEHYSSLRDDETKS